MFEKEAEEYSVEKENEQLKQQIKLYKEMLDRNPCVRIPDWHCSDCLEENTKLKQQLTEVKNGGIWHDLRKNPDDLPNKYRYVIAVFYDCFNDEIKVCIARLREDSEWEVNGQVYSNVVAWIEIPQF